MEFLPLVGIFHCSHIAVPSSVVGLTHFCVCLHTRCSFAFLPCSVPPQTPLQVAPPNLHLPEVLSFPSSPSLPLASCLSRSSDSRACRYLEVSTFCSYIVVPLPCVPRWCSQAGAESIMEFCKEVPICDRNAKGQCQAEI